MYRHEGWEVRVAPGHLEAAFPAATTSETHIGITGTRAGCTQQQTEAIRAHLIQTVLACYAGPPTFHHGGCVGADRDLHRLVREVWGRTVRIVIHPAIDQPAGLCDWTDADEMREPAPSLVRNRAIVDAIRFGALYACPKGMMSEMRSGTWATIRYAERMKKGAIIFWPDGTTG